MVEPESDQSQSAKQNKAPAPSRRLALYPNEYVWFIFVSAMDLFMTNIVLHFGGEEVNPLARSVLMTAGLRGLVVFKFALVIVVIVCCEIIGRKQARTGRWLARFAVGITALPMVLAFIQLLAAKLAG
jgi:hypothetical protein